MARPIATSAPSTPRRRDRLPWAYMLAFLLGTGLVVGFMWFHIDSERRAAEAQWKTRVSTIADDRARLVNSWLAQRQADAEVMAVLPAVRSLVTGGSAGDGAVAVLDRIAKSYGYSAIAIVDRQGRVLARSAEAGESVSPSVAIAATRAGDFRVELAQEVGERRSLHFALPVFADPAVRAGAAEGRPALGAVVLRMPPETSLFALLREESVPTKTGEILLFRPQGLEPTYLSPFRHTHAGQAALRRSLEELARADGGDGFREMIDYRALTVFAATRVIPSTGWGMVLKVDREEALTEFHQSGRLAGLAAAFLTLALAAFLIGLWRQQQRASLLNEQIKQERAIFHLKSYAEKIVASVPSGLLVLSGDLRVLSANRSFLESFLLHHDDVLGRRLEEVVQGDGLMSQIREALVTGVAQHEMLFDLRLAARRETRPARITMTGIRIAEEEDARLLLIVQDLTEEERLHAARRASEQRFRDLVQSLDAIVWEADVATLRFTFVSQRAEKVLGYPVDHWLREREFWAGRIHPEDRERALAQFRAALNRGEDHEFEYRSQTANGGIVWLRDIVHVVRDPQAQARQLRGITVDVTGRKRAEEALHQREEQLRQSQKMEAVGQLAGGIAHDFNNLLMVIQGDGDLLRRRIPEASPLRRNVDGIREAAQQAAALTRQLLAFSRKQVLEPRIIDVNQIVGGMDKMLQRLIGETIQLVTVLNPEVGQIKADPGQLEQVIMNLAVNARDAMPDGGQLTIETGTFELDEVAAKQHGEANAGRYAMLAVTDTGCGMDAPTQARLFEPFFTTKEQGKGTGLGLSTVYGIVKQSGGHIWVYSEVGRGTAFKICLPVAEVPAIEHETVEIGDIAGAQARSGAETVLLVEDAQRVREVVREILEMNGYHILEAKNGLEALDVSKRYPETIHLLLTDVVMPQMSGREVAQRLGPQRPDMKVLYMSGYTDDAIVRHGVLESGTPFLSKPFTPDALTTKVRAVLDGKATPEPAGVGAAAARPSARPRR